MRNDIQHAGEIASLALQVKRNYSHFVLARNLFLFLNGQVLENVKQFHIRHRPGDSLLLRIGRRTSPYSSSSSSSSSFSLISSSSSSSSSSSLVREHLPPYSHRRPRPSPYYHPYHPCQNLHQHHPPHPRYPSHPPHRPHHPHPPHHPCQNLHQQQFNLQACTRVLYVLVSSGARCPGRFDF